MEILRFLHSWTRWAVLVCAVVAIVWFVIGLIQKRPAASSTTVMRIFSTLIGIQWVLGIIFLVEQIGLRGTAENSHFWAHLGIMTLAVVVANSHYAWRRRELPDEARYRNNLLVIVAVIVLVIVGILMLPSGMQWQFRGLAA